MLIISPVYSKPGFGSIHPSTEKSFWFLVKSPIQRRVLTDFDSSPSQKAHTLILLPADRNYCPDKTHLAWHRKRHELEA
jgi:hypothetical protein